MEAAASRWQARKASRDAELAALRDENARLREALEQIEQYEAGRDPDVNSLYSMMVAHCALAADGATRNRR